jgi:hypothetical protein
MSACFTASNSSCKLLASAVDEANGDAGAPGDEGPYDPGVTKELAGSVGEVDDNSKDFCGAVKDVDSKEADGGSVAAVAFKSSVTIFVESGTPLTNLEEAFAIESSSRDIKAGSILSRRGLVSIRSTTTLLLVDSTAVGAPYPGNIEGALRAGGDGNCEKP